MPQNLTRKIRSVRNKPIGLLVVISAPSGAGKTTISQGVLNGMHNMVRAVTVTSRPKRPGEVHGKDYFFVTESKFRRMVKENHFIEWASVHNYLYGTPRKWMEQKVCEGRIVLLVIDVQGAENIKKIYPDAVLVFLLPPSMKELKERLKKRETESKQSLTTRIRNAMIEYKFIHDYDYAVVNDIVENAVDKVKGILIAEQCRVSRWIQPKP